MTNSSDAARIPNLRALSADVRSAIEPGGAFRGALLKGWNWLTRHGRGVLARGASRRLKIVETVSLGEKTFVSILQVDGEQFLIGGSPANIVLLARLEPKAETRGVEPFEHIYSRIEPGVVHSGLDCNISAEVGR